MVSFGIDVGTKTDLLVEVTPKNIKIIDSYRIQSKKVMEYCIREILYKAPIYHTKRSIISLVYEWRTHNIFYYHNWFKESTKDCDLESNTTFILRIIYYIFGRF